MSPLRPFLVLLLFLLLGAITDRVEARETRAVWFSTVWGLDFPTRPATTTATITRQQNELIRKLDSLQQLNINLIFFQTRLRADMAYRSELEPWHYVFGGKTGADPGYDLLQFAIEACHERGMEFHAWMVCMPIGSIKGERDKGELALSRRRPELCLLHDKEWYLNPAEPQTAHYLADLAEEITKRYPIDGIHLDYIRYPDHVKGYPDGEIFRKSGASNLGVWRRENINRIVGTIHDRVKATDPKVLVSCAVIGRYSSGGLMRPGWRAYDDVFQDAVKWIKEEKCDFVVPMLYYNSDRFLQNLEDWTANIPAERVVAGLYTSMLDPKEKNWEQQHITAQIEQSAALKIAGVAHFRAKPLFENEKGIAQQLKQGAYANFVHPHLPSRIGVIDNPCERIRLTIDDLHFEFDNSALQPMFHK